MRSFQETQADPRAWAMSLSWDGSGGFGTLSVLLLGCSFMVPLKKAVSDKQDSFLRTPVNLKAPGEAYVR